MNLSYGNEYVEFRQQVKSFLKSEWPLEADIELTTENRLSKELKFRKAAIKAGYLARSIPCEYGGSEQPTDPIKSQIVTDEFSRLTAPLDPLGIGLMMLVPTLLEHGTEWQKKKWIQGTILGQIKWCQGYSEPSSGSDLASLRTKGILKGDQWTINGQKAWTSSAKEADYMFCLVRTEPEACKHRGISYLIIDMNQPGVDVCPIKQLNGGSQFNEVFLSDVTTPSDWIVGERGNGWLVSRTTLKHERNSLGDSNKLEKTFEQLLDFARTTEHQGCPAIAHPMIRQRLGVIEAYVMAHKYSGLRQMTCSIKEESAGILELMNKLHVTNINHDMATLAFDILADDGLLDPMGGDIKTIPSNAREWVNYYMATLGIAIAGGTANIQRNVIAERGLGLARG